MEENTGKNEAGGRRIPVTMSWHGVPTLCLSKEEAAKQRPRNSSSMPVSIVWLKDPTRHLLKTKAADERANRDDSAPPAQTNQKPGRRDSDSPGAE